MTSALMRRGSSRRHSNQNSPTDIDWAGLCEPVARIVWGKPTRETPKELRWGTHGVAAMNFQALTDLAGGRLGVIDTVCPLCSHQRRPQNRRKRVLRCPLWRQGLRLGRQSAQAHGRWPRTI
jgi:hypothetical protein